LRHLRLRHLASQARLNRALDFVPRLYQPVGPNSPGKDLVSHTLFGRGGHPPTLVPTSFGGRPTSCVTLHIICPSGSERGVGFSSMAKCCLYCRTWCVRISIGIVHPDTCCFQRPGRILSTNCNSTLPQPLNFYLLEFLSATLLSRRSGRHGTRTY
jgi:hypothetical protein